MAKKGVTLVELLVVMAVGVMVMGLLLGIFISTNGAAIRENKKAAQWQEAALIARQVEDALNGWISNIPETELKETFLDKKAGFFRIDANTGNHLVLSSLTNIMADERTRAVMIQKPIPKSGEEDETLFVLGIDSADLSTSVTFQYATEMKDLKPVWKPTLTEGERPLLVKYIIVVQDMDQRVKPVALSSSVLLEK
jgi:prepilin-type N-terminal cleavage/methylation domain-containing protein